MLSREEFVFTIGYDGPVAVVDKHAKNKYGKLSTRELAAKGLFRAAYSSAVHSGDAEELKFVAEAYNRLAEQASIEQFRADISTLARLFGVFPVDVKRSVFI